jgi:hypothetical protein
MGPATIAKIIEEIRIVLTRLLVGQRDDSKPGSPVTRA